MPSIASADCHCHCTPPSSSHSATSTAQIRSKIPAAAQRWNQSWTVLLGPYRSGNGLHWQPLRIRKMIALSIFRQLATLRPVGFLGQNSTRIGSILRHNSSEISQIVPSGLRRGFRRTMAQSPVVVPASSHFSLQTPFCKRYSAGSRIVSTKDPRPEAVVLGRPPRGGHCRVVAPVGGVDVKATHAIPRRSATATPTGRLALPSVLWASSFGEAELTPFRGRSTPDRSKLFGSHGQRPWVQHAMKVPKALLQGLMQVGWSVNGMSSLVSSNLSYIDKSTVVIVTAIARGRPRS